MVPQRLSRLYLAVALRSIDTGYRVLGTFKGKPVAVLDGVHHTKRECEREGRAWRSARIAEADDKAKARLQYSWEVREAVKTPTGPRRKVSALQTPLKRKRA